MSEVEMTAAVGSHRPLVLRFDSVLPVRHLIHRPPTSRLSPLRWLLVLVSFAAAAGVALWVIRSHWPEGGVPLGLPWWAHVAALGAVTFELTLRSAKIALSARACGIPLQFGTAARATLGGDFATAITPARVGAEPARFLVLREAGVPAARALLVLFLELLIELVSLVIIAGILLAVLPATGALKGVVAMVGTYATVILGLGFGAWLLSRRRPSGPPPRWVGAIGLGAGFWRGMQAVAGATCATASTPCSTRSGR